MPIYEYLCESCGKVNERLQKVNDPPPPRCDECGGRKLAKLVSRSAFQLKGGGWYSDLYASRKKEAPAGDGAARSDGTPPTSGKPATGSAGTATTASAAAPGSGDAARPSPPAPKGSAGGAAGAGRSGKARGAGKGG